jgi:integrase
MAANLRINNRVQPETISGRIRALRKLIEWLFKKFHYNNSTDNSALQKYEQLMARIKLNEEDLGRNKNTKVRDIEESLIPDNVYHKLLEMILPSSPNNPFKSSKIRNYLIVSLFIQSGIRRGALAKIKISDCRFYGTYDEIHIYRSGTDPTDARNDVPNQKTKDHLSVVDKRLMEQIKFYIDHIRIGFNQSASHDFIFVSEKNSRGTAGLPLSLKSLNGIFEKLSESLDYRIHPHMLRHKWNEIFDVEAKAIGKDSKLIEDIRKYAMGWSANSTMNQRYNEKRLHEQAREIHKARQDRINNQ